MKSNEKYKVIAAQINAWSIEKQIAFSKEISFRATILGRDIWATETTTDLEKVEAFKLLNEFMHRTLNHQATLENKNNAVEAIDFFMDRFTQLKGNEITKTGVNYVLLQSFEKINELQMIGKTNIYDILDKIRLKPALWLSEVNLTRLQSYIDGFFEGANGQNHEEPTFAGFNSFVDDYYGYIGSTNWRSKILDANNNDEKKAFTAFYELLDVYRKLNGNYSQGKRF